MLQVLRDDPGAHEASLLDRQSVFISLEMPVLEIHELVTCRCQRRPTLTVLLLGLNVLLPSLLRVTANWLPLLLAFAFAPLHYLSSL